MNKQLFCYVVDDMYNIYQFTTTMIITYFI